MVKFSEQQLEIINSESRRIVVNSVAGSGKTTTIKAVIRKAIASGVKPDDILVCTFTRKMAKELKEKNKQISWCDTIHGISLRIVEKYCKEIGYEHLILIDEIEDAEQIKNVISRNYLKVTLRRAGELIQEYCTSGDMDGGNKQENIFMKTYLRELRSHDFVTYSLLEYYARTILNKHPEIGFELVVVDEYQDTSIIENEIINLLAKNRLIVVGDVMQSIYGFRGATADNIMTIPRDKSYSMNTSYRVPDKISELANKLIGMNTFGYDQRIISNTKGGTLRIVENSGATSLYDEAMLALKLFNPEEIFILTRTNRQVSYIVNEIEGLPVDKEMSAVRNMKYLSYLNTAFTAYYNCYYNYGLVRLLRLFGYDDAALIGLESSGKNIYNMVKGDIPLREFDAAMKSDQPFIRKAELLLSMFEQRRGEYDTVMVKVLPYIADIESALDYMEWYKDMSVADFMPKDKIAVITVHTAKGMENEAVLIPFVEDGTFPNSRANFQEELRLFYVAVTRAKSYLSIMHRNSVFLQ